MKLRKIIALSLIALLLMSGVSFAASAGRDLGHGRGDVMGNGRGYDFDPHKTFRLVRYVPLASDDTAQNILTALAANSIVVWDITSDDGVTITTTSTSFVSTVAGIIVQTALTPRVLGKTAKEDLGERNWTWLQTYGKSLARVAAGADVTAGDALGTSLSRGAAGRYLGPGDTIAGSQLHGDAGFWYDTATSGTNNVEVFLRVE